MTQTTKYNLQLVSGDAASERAGFRSLCNLSGFSQFRADLADDALDCWFDRVSVHDALRFDGDSDAPVAMEVELMQSNLVALIKRARS